MTAAPSQAVASPFRGLAPFGDSDLDALLFFGRERETEVTVANLIASRLTVLFGPSGVGKTSLLQAGVARRLRELARKGSVDAHPDAAVVVFSSWADEPAARLAEWIAAEVSPLARGAPPPPAGSSLAEACEHWSAVLDGELYLVLDQLEEYFVYHGDEPGGGTLVTELPPLVLVPSLRVHVLLSLREDSLALLEVFKERIPHVFGNQLRLDRLDRRAARAAILGPVQRWNELVDADDRVTVEPGLVDDVLAQAASGADADRIEPPYLQLVMERMWDEEHDRGSRVLRQATLAELGGAGRIVRDHLDRALSVLDDEDQDAAARMFEHLVTPSGTKIAHRTSDLAQFARIPATHARPVLGKLAHERILRPLDDVEGDRYEIFHDVLAEAILDWRRRRELEQERDEARARHRKLVAVAGASLAALVVVSAIAIFALTQRMKAESQADHAKARELAARALLTQSVDPERSLRLAVRAARLDPTNDTESVLRSSLLESHLRSVLRVRSPVRAVATSRTGRRILTGSLDGVVRVWDPRAERVRRTIDVGGPVDLVAFDDAEKRVLVVAGGSAGLWDLASGRALVRFDGDGIVDAVFGRDDRTVAIAGSDGIAIARTRDGETERRFPHSSLDQRVVLSSDGRTLAAIGGDGQGRRLAWVYDTRTGRLLHRFAQRGVNDIDFSPNGTVLAIASQDGSTTLVRPRSGRIVRVLTDEGGGVADVAFSPSGRYLATGASDGGVRIWRPAVGDRWFFFIGHTNPITRIDWSPDGAYVVSASKDRTARVVQVGGVTQGGLAGVLAGHGDTLPTALFSRNGGSIVTASDDGTARVWDATFEQYQTRIGGHLGPAETATFSANGRLAVTTGADHTARVWDVTRARMLAVLPHRAAVRSAEFTADGNRVVTASDDHTAGLWTTHGRRLATFRHPASVVRAVVSPDGRLLATATAAGTIALWRPSGRLVARRDHRVAITDVAFTPDGRRLVAAGADGFAWIYSVEPFRIEHSLKGHRGQILRLSISRDGETIATAGEDGTARLWSPQGTLLHVLGGHREAVTDVDFAADGKRVVTASADSDGRIWDVATGRRLQVLRGTFAGINAAAFSPDGGWLATAGPISAALWPSSTGRLLVYVRPRGKTRMNDVEFSPDGHLILTAGNDGGVRIYRCDVCGALRDLIRLAEARLDRARPTLRRRGG